MMELPKSAFQIFENGVKQEIKSFRHEDVPVSLGLIIDSSASMTNKRDRVAAAALALVQSSNPDDEVFIVNFADTPSLDVDFTSDAKVLKKGLARVDSHGETAMRDAIRTAIEHLKEAVADSGSGRAATAAMASLAEAIHGLVNHMRTEQQMIRDWADAQAHQQREVQHLLERIAREDVHKV